MTVTVDQRGPVVTVTIDRPDRRNAVDASHADALRTAFHHFDSEPSASVAVLHGAGGHFCAGADLKALGGPDGVDVERRDEGPMGPTRTRLGKPVIAAISGFAVAGGLELALWCDLRIADETAVFGVFCRRWGVPLVDGGTVRLPRVVGAGRAMDMILTGRSVDAAEAAAWGLVDRLVPAGAALSRAQELAASLARFPQTCLRSDRSSMIEQYGMSEADAMLNERRLGMAAATTEARAGAASFASGEGRHGVFE